MEERKRSPETEMLGSAVEGECFECQQPSDHRHHVVPFSLGGNCVVPLCHGCHSKVHGKDLLRMSTLAKAAKERQRARGERSGPRSTVPPEVQCRIVKMVEDGRTLGDVARALVADGTWPMPDGYQGKTYRHVRSKGGVYYHSPQALWHVLRCRMVEATLRSVALDRLLEANATDYEANNPPQTTTPLAIAKGSNLLTLF